MCASSLIALQLTPFVTKVMAPTKSRYTHEIERNGKTFIAERGLQGKDFLDLWASENGEEVLKQEEMDKEEAARQAKAAAKATKAPRQ
jgi:large subunit ribosomal protein L41